MCVTGGEQVRVEFIFDSFYLRINMRFKEVGERLIRKYNKILSER